MKAKSPNPRPRPKAPVIRTINESAPWVLLSKAAKESGLTMRLIRRANLPMRQFGNADYISPSALNSWILEGWHSNVSGEAGGSFGPRKESS